MLTATLQRLHPPRGGSALPGLGIVCCINVVISASQVEGNGECLCQFDFLTLRLSPLSLVICSDFNNPCQTPNSSPHSAPLLCRPCAPCATLPDRADRKLNIHLSCTKGGLSSWTNIIFLPLTASPVKLVLYYFFLSSSLFCPPPPHHRTLPLRHCLRGGLCAQQSLKGSKVLNPWIRNSTLQLYGPDSRSTIYNSFFFFLP